MLEISALVTATWTALQPLLPIIAIKGAEEIGKRAVGEVWDLVKKKFDQKPDTQKVFERLLKDPQNAPTQGAFQYHLQDLLESDAAFAAELAKLLLEKQSTYSATLIGDGAIAQGDNTKAVGAGGIMIGGNVSGGIHQAEKKDKK